jgi:hypothetical protein
VAPGPNLYWRPSVGAVDAHTLKVPAMIRLKTALAATLVAIASLCHAQPPTTPIPPQFAGTGTDRQAIEALLDTYTRAVSTKDEALFETLLLSRDIPFSDVGSATRNNGAGGTRHYGDFRRGVFSGAAFTQKFQDVHIAQDGPLADVSLVFVNTAADGSSWGWKTLQLLKVGGQWKIASEFYTGHG